MKEEQEFEGVYVAHWEVSRFIVQAGKGLFGLWQRIEKWCPSFPETFVLPEKAGEVVEPRGPARYFRMRVRGRLGPKGSFGHRGICNRELVISEVLDCEETSTPGKTW